LGMRSGDTSQELDESRSHRLRLWREKNGASTSRLFLSFVHLKDAQLLWHHLLCLERLGLLHRVKAHRLRLGRGLVERGRLSTA